MQSAKHPRPGRLTAWLMTRMSQYTDEFGWPGDLEEEYLIKVAQIGCKKARLWYVRQILKSLPSYLKYILYGGIIMYRNYLITALRNLKRSKSYSLLNISGLALGIACFMLITMYVQYEMSFDGYHTDADRIYRVCSQHPFVYQGKNQSAITAAPLAPALRDELPEIQASVRLTDINNVLLTTNNRKFIEKSVFFSGPDIFSVFSLPLTKGEPLEVLKDPFSLIMSERMAEKYFAAEDPIGKTIVLEDEHNFTVTGILKNIPVNSHFIPDFIAPFSSYVTIHDVDVTSWWRSAYYTYIKLKAGFEPQELEAKLTVFLNRGFKEGESTEGFRLFLQPIKKIHLHSDLIGEISVNNSITTIYTFGFIAFLILVTACINYMNLVTAHSSHRGKEVGVRKVIGAQRSHVVKQFLGEAGLLIFLALIVAFFLVYFSLPVFNSLVGRDFSLGLIINPQYFALLAGMLVFICIFAGSYPALVIASLKPALILKGMLKKRTQGISLRSGLVVIQFSISIILIICTIIVNRQINFIHNMDVGYSRESIVALSIRDPELRKNLPAFKAELLSYKGISAVATASNLPHRVSNLHRARSRDANEEEYFPMYQCTVDYDFIDLFEINILHGRNFSREYATDEVESIIINEAAVKALGYSDPVGQEVIVPLHGGIISKRRIIGVIKDFNMLSLYNSIKPLNLVLDRKESQRNLVMKVNSTDLDDTLAYISAKMNIFSSTYPFEYRFFDDVFRQVYQNEQKLGKIFNVFGLISIFIACLGLLGLASFSTEQRAKEIGVRKVLGASTSGLVILFTREFTRWVLLANLIAWPAAFFIMNSWLKRFVFRVPIEFWTFFLAGVLALGIALCTVSLQALKAAATDPVNSLKYE